MRAIKFRAWAPERKGWVDFGKTFENGGLSGKDNGDGLNGVLELQSNEHMVFMQFTGLIDKNGVQIFEGDVLEYVPPFELDEDDTLDRYQNLSPSGSRSFVA